MDVNVDVLWCFERFDSLAPSDVYDLLALRCAIFVVEQRCAYLDVDGADRLGCHLLGRTADGALVACARALPPGERFDDWSIGRVAVVRGARGRGLARALMHEMMTRLRAREGPVPIALAAQAHLVPFYASLGFVPLGGVYDEDGIPHVKMRASRASSNP